MELVSSVVEICSKNTDFGTSQFGQTIILFQSPSKELSNWSVIEILLKTHHFYLIFVEQANYRIWKPIKKAFQSTSMHQIPNWNDNFIDFTNMQEISFVKCQNKMEDAKSWPNSTRFCMFWLGWNHYGQNKGKIFFHFIMAA